MDKFEEKVLNTLENLEKAGVITSTPAGPFKYVADIYFNDGTEIVLPFETMNKEDYRSAFRAVCEILDSSDEYKSHGKYIVGGIRENDDPDPTMDDKFEDYLLRQNDTVDNAAMALINALSRTDAASWNMEYIGAVVDAAVTALRKYDIECCYPYYSSDSVESEWPFPLMMTVTGTLPRSSAARSLKWFPAVRTCSRRLSPPRMKPASWSTPTSSTA